MWNNLTSHDIEQAKQQLQLKREEILRRHAEEIGGLDADEAEVETLDRLADVFSGKFKIGRTSAPEPAIAPEPAVTTVPTKSHPAYHHHGGKRSGKPNRHADA